MRLIVKITLFYLVITLVVFLIGYIITNQVIMDEVDMEQERFLRERLQSATRMIERRAPTKPFEREKIKILPLDSSAQETKIAYSDTLVMHQSLQRMEPHLKLDVVRKIGGRYYFISIYDLIVEEDDIEEGVRESLIKMYLILSGVVILLAALSSYWLLQPFNSTLDKIKKFNLKGDKPVFFGSSGTKEFNKLNQFLDEMTHKMRKDYLSLKEFTENASHEMQTPIAIATGKLELLQESADLNDEQNLLVTSAQDSIRRLSKIGNALSLLAKIENQEFAKIEKVDISQITSKLLYDFKELMELKEITLEQQITSDVKVEMDSILAAIMVTNLLQNSIRHNEFGGRIEILLNKKLLSIKNTGQPLSFEPDQMFERFKKNDQNRDSVGLGLAIVKKICEVNNFKIVYQYEANQHNITITF